MRKQTVNLWAVLVCVVIGQIIPALWYNFFSEQWIALNGFSPQQLQAATSPAPYFASIVSTSFMAYSIAWIFTKIPIKSGLIGFLVGLLFSIVFILFETIVKDMFSMRPLELSLINGGVSVIVFSISGFILGFWRKYQ
jgi:uncharacterized membrane protein